MLRRFKLVRRLRSLFRKERLERELDEELRFHLDWQIDANVADGMSPEQARYAALRSLGGLELFKDQCRDVRGVGLVEDLGKDVRHSLRLLCKSPGFTVVTVLTLVLGIGATTAMFSVVSGVLVRRLPFPDADRIVTLWNTLAPQRGSRAEASPPGSFDWRQAEVSPADFCDWREQSRAFAQMAAYESFPWILAGDGEPLRLRGERVSGDFFAAMGVAPVLGRPIVPADDHEGTHRVVVLGYGLWNDRFGGDLSVLGRQVILTGVAHTVVGVMPAGFRFPRDAEVWTPLAYEPPFEPSLRRSVWLRTVARLKRGVTLADAQSDLSAVAQRLAKQYPDTNDGRGVLVVSLHEQTVEGARRALLVLMGAVGFLLLIACANLVNLLLARTIGRRHELALRAALGAGRRRLMRQLVTESAVLGLLGGAGGCLLAWLCLAALRVLDPGTVPRLHEVALDRLVLGFALLVSLAAGAISGILPAMMAARTDLASSFREGSRTVVDGLWRRRLRSGLVAIEIGLALVLLVAGGLLLRSFLRLNTVDLGFDPRGLLVSRFDLFADRYEPGTARQAFYRDVVGRVTAVSGVESVAMSTTIPLHEVQLGYEFVIEGRPVPSLATQYLQAGFNAITPDYFRAIGILLVSGRVFTDADRADTTPVIIINRTMARRFWPGENPLGRRIRLTVDDRPPLEIVGVVDDVRQLALDGPLRPEIYLPYAQHSWREGFLLVRSSAEPAGLAAEVRRVVRGVDRSVAWSGFQRMSDQVSSSLDSPRFRLVLLGVFAMVAVSLAAAGVFGVVSYSVSQRMRDYAVRLALGATRRDIYGLVVSGLLPMVLVGVCLGLTLSLALAQFLSDLLFEVRPTDPGTYAVVAAVLSAVAVAAGYVPSRRALEVDPVVALRHE